MADGTEKIRGVYLIEHRDSGRCYVGWSSDILKRFSEHCSRSLPQASKKHRDAPFLHRAIAKHGTGAFRFALVQLCSDDASCKRQERLWIATLGTMAPHGFNLSSGGDGNPGASRNFTAEWRANLSASHRGKKHSEATRLKMSLARRGKKPAGCTRMGARCSAETRKRMSDAAKGRVISAETRAKISSTKRARYGR